MSVFMYHHSSVDDVSSIFLTSLSLFFLSDKGVIDFAKSSLLMHCEVKLKGKE